MKIWHVTPTKNIFDILEQGLVPAIGPRSEEIGEDEPQIYVFTDPVTMEDAICNWLGEAFEEDEELSIIELDIAPERLVVPEDLYEAYILETVEPSCIVRIVAEQEWGVSVEKHPGAITQLEDNHRP